MTTAAHNQERRVYSTFATTFAEEAYRPILDSLYGSWRGFNRDFFDRRLIEPHIRLGGTAPRSLGSCEATTGYGGRLEITLNGRLLLDPVNREWVVNRWPAPGLCLLVEDLLLRMTVRQFVLEILEAEERGYRGFGPRFAKEATRIGLELGLAAVTERNRAGRPEMPLCAFWPHNVRSVRSSGDDINVRSARYYGDDITESLLDLATGGRNAGRRLPAPPSLGLLEVLLYLLREKRVERAEALLIRHIDRLQEARTRRYPVRRRVEAGLEDVDGSPLGNVPFDPCWLSWNNGTVRKVAEAVHELRAFGELPILADALEEAGCGDPRILRHLRAKIEHTGTCWVLCKLLETDRHAEG